MCVEAEPDDETHATTTPGKEKVAENFPGWMRIWAGVLDTCRLGDRLLRLERRRSGGAFRRYRKCEWRLVAFSDVTETKPCANRYW